MATAATVAAGRYRFSGDRERNRRLAGVYWERARLQALPRIEAAPPGCPFRATAP